MVDHKVLRKLAERAGASSPDWYAFVQAATPSAILSLLDETEALRKDAERYGWLSRQNWWTSDMLVVAGGAESVKLGAECLSGDFLDTRIDSAMAQEGRA